MLKLVAQNFALNRGNCIRAITKYQQRLPTPGVYLTQKFFSESPQLSVKIVVKGHYEFDQKVINSVKPVIVNFHAEWCDPCKILTPKITLLLENDKDIDLAVVDVDQNAELVETFEVKAVPAVVAFRNGVIVDKFIGLNESNSIENIIKGLREKMSK